MRRSLRWLVLVGLLPACAAALGWAACAGLTNGRDADVHRRWLTAQYVRAGEDPYVLSRGALERQYGTLDEVKQSGRAIHAIPRHSDLDVPGLSTHGGQLLATWGPPEAVYPPSAELWLGFTLGTLPETWVHAAGMVGNLGLLILCAWLLAPKVRLADDEATRALAWAAGLLLVWTPTYLTLVAGQFGLLVLACLLGVARCQDRRPWLAGLLLALALIKPTMALPFLVLPLLRGRWRVAVIALGLHGAALAGLSLLCGTPPWELVREWLYVGGYFTQGMYTLQDFLNVTRLNATPVGRLLPLLVLLAAWAWCWRNRRAELDSHFDFLCLVAAWWTYHGVYDLVLLLPPLARLVRAARAASEPGQARVAYAALAIGVLTLLSVATTELVTHDETVVGLRFLRWAARLVLVVWLAGLAAWLAGRRFRIDSPRTASGPGAVYHLRAAPPPASPSPPRSPCPAYCAPPR